MFRVNSDNPQLLIYVCDLCQQEFEKVQQLVSHKKTIHTDELYEVTYYPSGLLPASSALAVLTQCCQNGEIVPELNDVRQAAVPWQPGPPIRVQMTGTTSMYVAPGSTDVKVEMDNSGGIDPPLLMIMKDELDNGESRISCWYCGDLFSDFERDEVDPSSCKSCAGNTSVSRSNSTGIYTNSAKIVSKSCQGVGLHIWLSPAHVAAVDVVSIPQILAVDSSVVAETAELNNFSSCVAAEAKHVGDGAAGPCSSVRTVTGNVNGNGSPSSSSPPPPVVKKLSCKFCNKKFLRTGNLKSHERIHTGEKPYSCRVCSNSFAQSSTRNRHEKLKHGLERPAQVSKAHHPRAAVFGKTTADPKTLHAADTGKSTECAQISSAVVSRKKSREIPRILNTHQDEEYSDDVPIGDSVSALAGVVVKPFSTENETVLTGKEDNFNISAPAEKSLPPPDGDDDDQPPVLYPEEPLSSYPRRRSTRTYAMSMSPPVLAPEVDRSSVSCQQNQRRHIKSNGKGRRGKKNVNVDNALKRLNVKLSNAFKTAKAASLLVSHATDQHAKDKPLVCTKCPVRFSNWNLLRIHLGGHDGHKPLLCLECGKWFRYDVSFKQHFMAYHTIQGQVA